MDDYYDEVNQMSSIGGISGFGGVDPSMWVSMNNMAHVSPATSMSSAPAMGAAASLSQTPSLQTLVDTIRQCGITEILLALLLAARTNQSEQTPHAQSATNLLAPLVLAGMSHQCPSINAQFETSSMTIPADVAAGAALNAVA